MTFKGWPAEAFDFFEGLEADNSKTYWQANKATYDSAVREPMELLLAELEKKRYGPTKIFRPNRDIRFSADKSPYKTNIAAITDNGPYLSLSADGLGFGRGYYTMAKDQLEKYRVAVDDGKTGRALERLCDKIGDAGIDIESRDVLKTAPRGYPKDHPRIELLRCKGLVAFQRWDPARWMQTKKVVDRAVEFTKATQPLARWLDTHVGPSEIEESR